MHHLHREKLFSLFDDNQKGVVYIQGAETLYRHETDYEYPFRQESNFLYLTGVNEPGCSLLLDLSTKEYHLFVPKRDAQFAVWHGYIKSLESYSEQFKPDHIHYSNKILDILNTLEPETIFCLNEEQAEFIEDLKRDFKVETETLVDAITYCRVLKTDWELDQMREAARINNIAHRAAAKAIKNGAFEYQVKATLEAVQIEHGLTQPAYNGIYAAGKNSAILHYVENSTQARDNELFLIDAGFEYNGYASDYSRTYPVSGRFSPIQAGIYQAVLDALNQIISSIKPGEKMEDLHLQAARIMMQGLKDLGLISGSIDDMMECNLFALFFPHGLGHFLGLDTHDVGGYPKGVDRIDRPGIQFLRARRDLHPGMVITIEPGLYFIPALLLPAFEDKQKASFLNIPKLKNLLDFGGIRLEDNIIITETGYENMTDVPKEVLEVEKLMSKNQ